MLQLQNLTALSHHFCLSLIDECHVSKHQLQEIFNILMFAEKYELQMLHEQHKK